MNRPPPSPDELEARRLYPSVRLPGGLASTPRMVDGIRRKIARRKAAARRRLRLLGGAGALAACAAAVSAAWLTRGPAEEESAQAPARFDEAAFAQYEREFGSPEEAAFRELDALISALDYDFSRIGLQSI